MKISFTGFENKSSRSSFEGFPDKKSKNIRNKVLYNKGIDNTIITGGWIIYKTDTDNSSTFVKNQTNMVLSLNSTPGYGTFCRSQNKIDMSAYSRLTFNGSEINCEGISGKRAIYFEVRTELLTTTYTDPVVYALYNGAGTYTLDISAVNVPVYILIGGANYSTSGQTSIITIDSVVLTK